MRFAKIIAVLAITPFLAACMSAAPESVPNPYTVSQVDVVLVDGADVTGRFNKDPALRKEALAKIDATVTARAKALPGGNVDAKAEVVVSSMQLRNSASRTFGGLNTLGGHVTVKDAAGNVLKKSNYVSVSDQMAQPATINGIPIGLLANLAVSSANEETGRDLDRLVGAFASEVLKELRRGPVQATRTASLASSGQAAPASASSKSNGSTTTTSRSSAGKQLTEAQLQAEIQLAQQRAEAEALSHHNDYPCWQIQCERDVQRARKEAEARVRQNAASTTN